LWVVGGVQGGIGSSGVVAANEWDAVGSIVRIGWCDVVSLSYVDARGNFALASSTDEDVVDWLCSALDANCCCGSAA
jgi:hypothetical protein